MKLEIVEKTKQKSINSMESLLHSEIVKRRGSNREYVAMKNVCLLPGSK